MIMAPSSLSPLASMCLIIWHIKRQQPSATCITVHMSKGEEKVIHISSNIVKISHPTQTRCRSYVFLSHIQCKLFHSPPFSHSPCPSKNTEGCKPSPSNTATPCFCVICRALTARHTALQPHKPTWTCCIDITRECALVCWKMKMRLTNADYASWPIIQDTANCVPHWCAILAIVQNKWQRWSGARLPSPPQLC